MCGITKATDPNVSFHRIPKDPIMRAKWTDALHLQKENLWSSSRVGRMKLYHILKSTIPVSSYNQIVFICAFLTNFQPVLIPIPDEPDDSDVESYFKQLSDLDDDSDNAESSECDA